LGGLGLFLSLFALAMTEKVDGEKEAERLEKIFERDINATDIPGYQVTCSADSPGAFFRLLGRAPLLRFDQR
jgi:hypothetical protein